MGVEGVDGFLVAKGSDALIMLVLGCQLITGGQPRYRVLAADAGAAMDAATNVARIRVESCLSFLFMVSTSCHYCNKKIQKVTSHKKHQVRKKQGETLVRTGKKRYNGKNNKGSGGNNVRIYRTVTVRIKKSLLDGL